MTTFERIKLGDLVTWAKGFNIPRDDTSVNKSIPYLHYGDLYKKYDYCLNLPEVINDIIKIDSLNSVKESQMLHDGDIVFTLTSETVDDLGHCTLIINPDDMPFVSGMETTVLHLKESSKALPTYLNYIFQDERFRKIMRQYVTGMKVYRIHPKDLMRIEIDLPPLDVQAKIVSILDSFSESIINLGKINDNLLSICKTQYCKIVNVSSESMLLSDLADVCYGKDHKLLKGGNYPVYGSGGIMRYCEKPLYSGKESVLIPRKGTLNNVIFVSKPFWSVDTMFYTKMKNIHAGKYLYFWLTDMNLAEMNMGSAVPSMTTKILNDIEIPYPGDYILKVFDESIQPLFDEIELNKQQIAHLTAIRDCLLPKLMSSAIDIDGVHLATKYSFGRLLGYVLLMSVLHILLIYHGIVKRCIDPYVP